MMWWWMMRRWSLLDFHSFGALVAGVFVEIALARPCAAGVVINEVYYDHPGRDDGWEFVEIYNPDTVSCALSGWRLEALEGTTGKGRVVWAASPDAIIGPGDFLCIAGIERAPSPEYLLKGTLGNGPDAVRLVSPSGIVDLVGYGSCASGDLYETAPAPDVPAGRSLARKPDGFDSNRNDADFVPGAPTPGRRNFFPLDVGIRLVAEDVLPCRGTSFSLKLMLVNCGLEAIDGRVSILTEVRESGFVASSGEAERALALAASAADSFQLGVAAPQSPRFEVRAYLDGSPDDNPANDTTLISLAASPGAIVINEIMYRPDRGMSEWIEIVNASSEDCNLEGWALCDATGSKRLISSAEMILPPGGFSILAKDSAVFAAEHPACGAPVSNVEGGWPALNDTDKGDRADAVALIDGSGVLAERVSYRDLLGAERGRSIERISTEFCGDRAGGIWHRCADELRSTPGRENSMRIERPPSSAGLSVSPNPFSPRRDGEVSVTGRRAGGETGFLMRIFDRDGYEIRRVFGERGGADIYSCRWDGRSSGGARARTGLYVCLVEYIGPGGRICRKEKTCIVVAAD
jgi:hypothetical protein